MPKKKADCRIGERSYEEFTRIFKNKAAGARLLNINYRLIYEWKKGVVPSALTIAKIHYFGGDAMYILTGQRSIKNGEGGSGADEFV